MTQLVVSRFEANDTHTYSVYQIFTGTYGSDGSLGNVAAGQNFKTANGAGDGGTNLSAADAAKKVAGLESSASDSMKLETINKFVDLTGDAYGTVSAHSAEQGPGWLLPRQGQGHCDR